MLAHLPSGEGDGIWRAEPGFEERRQQRLADAMRTQERRGRRRGGVDIFNMPGPQRIADAAGALERGNDEGGTARRMDDNGDVMNEIDSDGFAIFDSLAFGRGLGCS